MPLPDHARFNVLLSTAVRRAMWAADAAGAANPGLEIRLRVERGPRLDARNPDDLPSIVARVATDDNHGVGREVLCLSPAAPLPIMRAQLTEAAVSAEAQAFQDWGCY